MKVAWPYRLGGFFHIDMESFMQEFLIHDGRCKLHFGGVMTLHKKFQTLFSYFAIIVGALLASFSIACVLLPNDAIDYGTAGIAIIISKLTGASLSLCVLLVFLPFLIVGLICLGKHFLAKTAVGFAVYTLGLALFEKIPFELNTEHFLAVAFGGILLGIGLSLILRNGGCIDGSEIVANVVVNKIYKHTGKDYSISSILIAFNMCVYIAVFVLINQDSAMLSLLVYIIATAIIDHFTDHFEAIKQITIITKDPDEIIREIKAELNKTCTVFDSRGVIAGENKTLICYVNYFELQQVKKIVAKNKGTFSTVSTIEEILR